MRNLHKIRGNWWYFDSNLIGVRNKTKSFYFYIYANAANIQDWINIIIRLLNCSTWVGPIFNSAASRGFHFKHNYKITMHCSIEWSLQMQLPLIVLGKTIIKRESVGTFLLAFYYCNQYPWHGWRLFSRCWLWHKQEQCVK